MELFGAAVILIGLLALIVSSVVLITSIIKNQKSKLVSGLMLITSIILMSLGAAIMSMDAPSNKQQTAKEESPAETEDPPEDVNDSTEEEVPVTNDESEVSNNDAEREYYLNEVGPVLDKLMNDFDDAWKNHWQVPFDKLGRSEISLEEVKQNLSVLDDKYDDLREVLDSLNPTSLSSQNSSEFEQYKAKFMDAITGRMFVVDNTIKAIDAGTLDETHVSNSLSLIEMADQDLFVSIAHWTAIKQRLDLLEE